MLHIDSLLRGRKEVEELRKKEENARIAAALKEAAEAEAAAAAQEAANSGNVVRRLWKAASEAATATAGYAAPVIETVSEATASTTFTVGEAVAPLASQTSEFMSRLQFQSPVKLASSTQLVVWGSATSSRALRVLWLLEELRELNSALAYEHRPVRENSADLALPAFASLVAGVGKVPLL